jgi:hypothetical protein
MLGSTTTARQKSNAGVSEKPLGAIRAAFCVSISVQIAPEN